MRPNTLAMANSLWRKVSGIPETPTMLVIHRAEGTPVVIEFVNEHHPDQRVVLNSRGVIPLLTPDDETLPAYAELLADIGAVEVVFLSPALCVTADGAQSWIDFMWCWSLADDEQLFWESQRGGPFTVEQARAVHGTDWVRRLFTAA